MIGIRLPNVLLIVAVFLAAAPTVIRADQAETLARAGIAYTKADFKTAIRLYEEAVRNGAGGAALFYNLGNAHFKNGDLARSILWYERARRLDPGDGQLSDNLAIANARIRDRVESIPLLFVVRWWNDMKEGTSAGGLFTLSCVFLWILAGTAFVFFGVRNVFVRRVSLAAGVFGFCLFVAAAAMFLDKREDLAARRPAIVTARSVTARSTPDATGIDAFTIHEGLKVEITDTRGNRLRIRLADGKDGWIDASVVERI